MLTPLAAEAVEVKLILLVDVRNTEGVVVALAEKVLAILLMLEVLLSMEQVRAVVEGVVTLATVPLERLVVRGVLIQQAAVVLVVPLAEKLLEQSVLAEILDVAMVEVVEAAVVE